MVIQGTTRNRQQTAQNFLSLKSITTFNSQKLKDFCLYASINVKCNCNLKAQFYRKTKKLPTKLEINTTSLAPKYKSFYIKYLTQLYKTTQKFTINYHITVSCRGDKVFRSPKRTVLQAYNWSTSKRLQVWLHYSPLYLCAARHNIQSDGYRLPSALDGVTWLVYSYDCNSQTLHGIWSITSLKKNIHPITNRQ